MANVTEQSNWELGIYQIETSDAVIGGVGGIANRQALQLANRTLWLKNQVAVLGTGKQDADSTLAALANLTTSANQMIYATGEDQFALTPLTAFIRTLLDDADAATARTTIGAAPLVSPALTGTPTAPTATDGTNTAQLATTAFVQAAVGGYLAKGGLTGGTITLTDLEASNPVIGFSGALTSNLTVVLPTTTKRLWAIYNATSGAYTLTVKTASGTGVTVAQGKRNLVYTAGTNVYDGFNDFDNIALTGISTAPTAAVGTNTTQVATTAFVNAEIAADRPFEATVANIKMSGTQAVGTSNAVARGDHVHPTDTSRVAKAGDTMTGHLKTRYVSEFVGFTAENPTEGKIAFFDAAVNGVIRGSLQIKPAVPAGEYGAHILVTPPGSTSVDRRIVGLEVYQGGLRTPAYGWLHDYFMKRSDCVTNWYPNHYAGTQVFKIRHLNLMIMTMRVDNLGADTLVNLPEAFTGVVHAVAIDAGAGKNAIGVHSVNSTQVRVFAGPVTSATIFIIGYKDNI